jgi:hypothetical protein
MTDIEDRLRDAFGAIDDQLEAPERARPRRHDVRALAAAAAIVIIAVSLAFAALITRDDEVDVRAAAVSPAEFDVRVGEICRQVVRDSSGVAPRFATAEAYAVSATNRLDVIDAAVAAITAVPPPTDDRGIPSRVLALLANARARAEQVIESADAGQLESARRGWAEIDPLLEQARLTLVDHGAEGCR